MNTRIRLIEELSLNAHPAIQTELFDGWIMRFANSEWTDAYFNFENVISEKNSTNCKTNYESYSE